MKYKILSINDDATVTVSFDADYKEQCLAGMPLQDEAELKEAIREYGRAYVAGLDSDPETPSVKVRALKGQVITASEA